MDEIYMNPNASVVVSGLPDRVNSQKLREHFQTGDGNSEILQLVTFSNIGAAVIEFKTPKAAANVLAYEVQLEVRRLSVVFPQDENKGILAGKGGALALSRFLWSLPGLHSHTRETRKSGSNQVSNENLADSDMDSDACLVVSGFPDYVNTFAFSTWTKKRLEFPEIGTALVEFSSSEVTAKVLANGRRLLEETGLQVTKMEPLLCSKEDETPSRTQLSQLQQKLMIVKQNLNSKEQQLETAKQNLKSKEQQLEIAKQKLKSKNKRLQQVATVNKSLQAALRGLEQENIQLKNELEADKRENERLKDQISATLAFSSLYEMTCDPRGVAVIINNIRFEDMAERHGAKGDTDRLREVFESLGFTVLTFTDLDHSKMVAAMKDQGKADHSNHDCFVCCIMSHGTMGKVFSSDDVGIDICEFMKPVNAKKCPSLKGKPKLFFIQACQGEKMQSKASYEFDGNHDAKPVPFICHEADFFLGLATVPGYVARRDGDGAPYVKHLAKLLRDFGPTHDLSAIMAMVCGKMNEINDDKFGWISSNHSTLRKNIIFNSK
ncbi:uncharacterized protein LOC144907801 [Branchiostoma floridae x Branchiostoma belcheri]